MIISDIIKSLHLPRQRVNLYLRRRNRFYQRVEIPKRRGGVREVFNPNAEIKLIQNFLNEKYLAKIEVSKAATAYKSGCSIKDNASAHIKNNHFLIIDIENFFDNMDFDIMQSLLQNELKLPESEIEKMLRLLTYQNRFAQGTVTAPHLSNVYMKEFDQKVLRVVNNIENGVYTRYSDDITISSTKFIDQKILIEIACLLEEINLKINEQKTYFSSYKDTLVITGLKINQKKITLSRNKKRELNNKIYHKLKYGDKSSETVRHIIGYLYFLMDIDPDYFNFINLKYKKDNQDLLTRLKNM